MPQDFSGQNLRGRSFKRQNLEGANFSYADIRSADFTNAILQETNFTNAQAGVQKRWTLVQQVFAFLLSALSGFLSHFSSTIVAAPFLNVDGLIGYVLFIARVAVGGLFAVTLIAIICEGFTIKALKRIVIAAIGISSSTTAFMVILVLANVTVGINPLIIIKAAPSSILVAIISAVSGTVGGVSTISGAFVVAAIIYGAVSSAGIVSGIVAFTITSVVAIAFANSYSGGAVAYTALTAILALSIYMARQALQENKKFSVVRTFGITLSSIGGTSFRGTNLTRANFSNAILKSADFNHTKQRQTNLVQVFWKGVKKLDCARLGNTYLADFKVRQLLVELNGQNQNYSGLNLEGVNLQGANLQNANFVGSNLNHVNLQDADLSRARLVQTQLDKTDFTDATLTGAYIQDWGITIDTEFDGVRCEYVYMRLPTEDNPDPYRKPDNRQEVFADGEFGDFIKPIFDTLDLYHNQGVDPRAIAIAFKELAEDNPEAELEIVAIERRGENKILLRAKTATTSNKSKLSRDYFINYNQLKALAEKDFQALIADKEYQINRLENMVMTALERPSFYANNSIIQGDTKMTGDRNINTGGGNYNERIERDYIQGNYYAAGQPQSLAQAAAEIQLLLKQLEQTYPTTTTSQQMVVAAEAINRIESNPLLKERVINAVKEGGLAAFEKAVDNPAGAFIVGAIKGWQEVEAED